MTIVQMNSPPCYLDGMNLKVILKCLLCEIARCKSKFYSKFRLTSKQRKYIRVFPYLSRKNFANSNATSTVIFARPE